MMRFGTAMLAAGAALGCAIAIGPAKADVTYTWETLSSEGSPAPTLSLSFTVSGDVSVNADSSFAGLNQGRQGPVPQVQYRFPPQLVAFDLRDSIMHLTMNSFISPLNQDDPDPIQGAGGEGLAVWGEPIWNFSLAADSSAGTATLGLSYFGNQSEIGAFANELPTEGVFSTDQVTTIDFASDGAYGNCRCTYTGELVATDPPSVPEPSSAWLMLGGVAMLGMIGGVRSKLA